MIFPTTQLLLSRVYTKAEEISGFAIGGSTGAVIWSDIGEEIVDTAIKALVGAIISGIVGSMVAHYVKLLLNKIHNRNKK